MFRLKIKDAVRTLLFKNKDIIYNQLYTEWGERLDAECVLGEYPRPQLRRNNYTILNGYWNYNITKLLLPSNQCIMTVKYWCLFHLKVFCPE